MNPDHVALLPAYLAAATAVLVLLTDLLAPRSAAPVDDPAPRRSWVPAVAATGALATAAGAGWVGTGPTRAAFCAAGQACSYVADPLAAVVAVLFALLTLGVLVLSAPLLRAGAVPVGEYCFLLTCSMTGGVVLGYAGDLITLIVALETLTLPLYLLVALRRTVAAAEGAVTFFVVSVVATAISLLGAALLYAATGVLHLRLLAAAFEADRALLDLPLAMVAVALLVAGLAFKVAAVPLHAWAPVAYDGAPLPVAAYLSTASKLGGVVALLYVWWDALPPQATGPVLAALSVLTMTVGNLVALRQTRMVRLLAWSSVAQAGYIIAPMAVAVAAGGRTGAAMSLAAAATVTYAVFFVVMEFGAFAAVVAVRLSRPTVPAGPGGSAVPGGDAGASAHADGGEIASYRGVARRHPWVGAALVLALIGLAGLPPGLAGLFAKVTVVRSLLGGDAGWLAVVVALNAVIGLAYYLRIAASLYAPAAAGDPEAGASESRPRPADADPSPATPRVPWAVAGVLAVATAVAVAIGFAPQLVLDAAALAAR